MARTAVITGCSSGFGWVTALRLAGEGWHVLATVRQPADAERLAAAAVGLPGAVQPALCDITRPAEVDALRAAVAARGPALQALVNNAGTAYPGPLELLPLAELRQQLEVNLVAHLGVTQALVPALKAGAGTIVNVSSLGGRIAGPMLGAYTISKHGLEAMSDVLRLELAPFGVKVVVIEPGSSPTAIWQTSLDRGRESPFSGQAGVYAPLAARLEQIALVNARHGFPAEHFAALVSRVLNAAQPRPRYALPWRAGLLIWLRRLLPDVAFDGLIRRQYRW
jgi:NAD(P)-dependent dehydrogenase (short-subunit alcohol dehydrogenase family)